MLEDANTPPLGHDGGPPLEDYYEKYCPPRFPQARTKRAKQNIAKRLRLPVIHAGHTTLIDPLMGDNRLRELAAYCEAAPDARRRGRPRVA
jgi:hypothetical protein